MLFSSVPFLYYFFPAVIILYIIVPKFLKNAVLLVASMFFYAWGEKRLVILFAFTILVTWILSQFIEKYRDTAASKACMWISVIIDLGLLGYFKYTDFFIQNINSAFGISIPVLRIALPIGISFYTFQLMSYTLDVYRDKVAAQKNLINFAAYVSMFPQLIAGPIVRYSDVAVQLENRTHSVDMVASGIRRFAIGLGKKVLIANVIGEVCTHFAATSEPSVLYYWMYAVAFTLQIYFDFSGYSDMAIGIGRMFGFSFMENFNFPYISGTITEFWRRWHISLSSWFKDYVYIPLGGNRKGMKRQLVNIFIVWMLTGFWHGAAWNFILWGLLYAVLLTVEKLYLKSWFESHRTVGHIYVLLAVMFGFVLFNADGLTGAVNDIAGMFSFGTLPAATAESLYYLRSYALVYVIAIIGATPLPSMLVKKASEYKNAETALAVLEPVFFIGILILVTAYLVDGSFNPFLYFRF